MARSCSLGWRTGTVFFRTIALALGSCQRILLYVKATSYYGIPFLPTNDASLQGSSDSDWSSSRKTGMYTRGFVITLIGGPVSLSPKKHTIFATSMCEVGYVTIFHAAEELYGSHACCGTLKTHPPVRPSRSLSTIKHPFTPFRMSQQINETSMWILNTTTLATSTQPERSPLRISRRIEWWLMRLRKFWMDTTSVFIRIASYLAGHLSLPPPHPQHLTAPISQVFLYMIAATIFTLNLLDSCPMEPNFAH